MNEKKLAGEQSLQKKNVKLVEGLREYTMQERETTT